MFLSVSLSASVPVQARAMSRSRVTNEADSADDFVWYSCSAFLAMLWDFRISFRYISTKQSFAYKRCSLIYMAIKDSFFFSLESTHPVG